MVTKENPHGMGADFIVNRPSVVAIRRFCILVGTFILTYGQAHGLELPPDDAAPSDFGTGQRWALLIGIDNYRYLPKLKYCARDMELLRDTLIKRGGYDARRVKLLSDAVPPGNAEAGRDQGGTREDPSLGSMCRALDVFLRQAKPEDAVLIAFAGHGLIDEKGALWLMPVDGDRGRYVAMTGLAYEKVQESLSACPARQKMVILDACHAGAASGDRGEDTVFNPDKLPVGEGTFALFSCGDNEGSQEDDILRQGIFTYFLAKALSGEADDVAPGNHDGLVTLDEAYQYAKESVGGFCFQHNKRKQTPCKGQGRASGDLILASRSSKPIGATLPAEQLREMLNKRRDEGRVSDELLRQAGKWIDVEDGFGPARDVKLVLSLLARKLIEEADAAALIRSRREQVDSNTAAVQSARRGKLRAVIVGVNQYRDLPKLTYCVGNARQIRDNLASNAARPVEVVDLALLLDERATEAAVMNEIERQVRASKADDLFVVYFAGSGVNTPTNIGAWCLVDAKPDSDKQAKDIKSLDRSDGLLRLDDVGKLVDSCAGHVLLIDDSCGPHDPWTANVPADDDSAARARVFIGNSSLARESEKYQGGLLTFVLLRALGGAVDVSEPRFFTSNLLALSSAGTRGLDVGPSPIISAGGLIAAIVRESGHQESPDGFVTLRELVLFAARHSRFLDAETSEGVVVRGTLGGADVVLTKSTLPVD